MPYRTRPATTTIDPGSAPLLRPTRVSETHDSDLERSEAVVSARMVICPLTRR